MSLMKWTAMRPGLSCLGRRGAVSVLMGVTLVVLLGLLALATDAAYLYFEKKNLQSAADAAALAGSALLPDTAAASTVAINYAGKNAPASQYGTVLRATDVVPGNWDATTRSFAPTNQNATALRVTLRRTTANGNPARVYFARIFGPSAIDLVVTATATYGTSKAWDVTIVQDVTQSFSRQIANSKAADLQLLNCQKLAAGVDSQFGLAVFTGFGFTQQPMANVGTNYSGLQGKINDLAECGTGSMPQCSGSNIAAGLKMALTNFTSTSYHPSSNLAGQAVVLLTDGIPNAEAGAQPYTAAQGGDGSCGSAGHQCTDDDLKRFAQAQADALSAQGISVFTIFYTGNGGSASDSAYLASLVRGKGKAYVTPDATALRSMMNNVCVDMPHALVD